MCSSDLAGPVVAQSDMPTTGSASYAGHAVGTVINGNARYIAAGTFSANFSFASRSGSMSITNFDGLNMSGTISSTNGRDYGSTLDITGKADLAGRAAKGQLKQADRIGAARTVVCGDDEWARRVCLVRDMASGEQTEVALDDLVAHLANAKG